MSKCAVNNVVTCLDPVAGVVEIHVEQPPPDGDWYGKLLRAIHARLPGRFVPLPFCEGHLKDIVHRSSAYMDSPDLWAPSVPNPPVFARGGRRLNGHKEPV